MSGFGLYETLRILVPGWFVVAFLDAGTRLAFGDTPMDLTPDAAAFVEFLENPLVGLGVALLAGLLLYAMDLPSKTVVYRFGDPDKGKEPPSRHLSQMLSNDQLKRRALSIYFFLQDEFMNQEAHRKVYLFGSLYRIFVDLRILAAISFVATVTVGLSNSSATPVQLPPTGWLLVITALWIAPYLYDVGQHAVNSVSKHQDSLRSFLGRRREELALFPLVVIAFLGNAAATALILSGGARRPTGILLAIFGVGVWLRMDLGKPSEGRWSGFWWWAARRLGASDERTATTHQRALLDVATYLPWVVGASLLSPGTEQAGPWVLAWLAFLLPLSLVLGYHKHEDRLRNSFGDQNTWLDLHSAEIEELDRQGRLPLRWWNGADQAPQR